MPHSGCFRRHPPRQPLIPAAYDVFIFHLAVLQPILFKVIALLTTAA